MSKISKLNQAFISSFQIDESQLPGLKYQAIPAWDSVGHMSLISALEESFDIMIDTDDVIDLSSYEKSKEIVEKYGIEL